jgi:hypothetical protein
MQTCLILNQNTILFYLVPEEKHKMREETRAILQSWNQASDDKGYVLWQTTLSYNTKELNTTSTIV